MFKEFNKADPEDIKSWLELLEITCRTTGERIEEIQSTLPDVEMRRPFNAGYTGRGGVPFTARGQKYVNFPLVYDNLVWVGYAPRNQCEIAVRPQERNW